VETFRFLKFPVYQESKLFYRNCCILAHRFSREFWELGDQLRRAALSVSLNIAEGSAKYSDKDFHRYLEIALGSIHESLACLDIARDLKVISEKDFERLSVQALSISKELGGLSKKLRSSH